MKKSRFTEEQIIGFLKQAEAGIPIKDRASVTRLAVFFNHEQQAIFCVMQQVQVRLEAITDAPGNPYSLFFRIL